MWPRSQRFGARDGSSPVRCLISFRILAAPATLYIYNWPPRLANVAVSRMTVICFIYAASCSIVLFILFFVCFWAWCPYIIIIIIMLSFTCLKCQYRVAVWVSAIVLLFFCSFVPVLLLLLITSGNWKLFYVLSQTIIHALSISTFTQPFVSFLYIKPKCSLNLYHYVLNFVYQIYSL